MRKASIWFPAFCMVLWAAAASAQPISETVQERLAHEFSAVLGTGDDARLLLIEVANGVGSTRVLSVGDDYRDGWRIGAIEAQAVTLVRGDQSTRVPLSWRGGGPDQYDLAQPPPSPGPLGLTNAAISPFMRYETALDRGDFKTMVEVNLAVNELTRQLRTMASRGGESAEFLKRFLDRATNDSIRPGVYQGRDAVFRVRADGVRTMVITTDFQLMKEFDDLPPMRGGMQILSPAEGNPNPAP